MKISEVMTRDVRVVQPDRTVREAARLMDEMNVGVLPVCDGRRLLGMITDRDITVRSTAAGLAPDQSYVRDVMTDNVEWCFEDDDVEEIVEVMSRHQIRRIPVVDRDKRLVGIVALGDLATDREQDAARALTRISTPSEPDRTGTPTRARADTARRGGEARLSEDERRELERRRREGNDEDGGGRSGFRGDRGRGSGGGLSFREEDNVRAAFGSFGRPGEERARNPQMRGGFGGEGYQNYGEDYAGHRSGPGGGGYRPRQFGTSDLMGRRERPGDDSSPDERRQQGQERARTLLNDGRDRGNYGVGPGNTRFGYIESGEHRGRGPKNYQRSDERIGEELNERLTDDARLDASEIDVRVENREVTLTGTVRDRDEKRRAEDIAESVSGVSHVQNDLRVGGHERVHHDVSQGSAAADITEPPGAGTTAGSRASGRERQSS
jgi:CBS domain-containing protein